jgi:hypothetical protein
MEHVPESIIGRCGKNDMNALNTPVVTGMDADAVWPATPDIKNAAASPTRRCRARPLMSYFRGTASVASAMVEDAGATGRVAREH